MNYLIIMHNLNNTLLADGFVIVDILDSAEIIYLNELCNKYLTNTQSDFIAASHFLSQAESNFINEELHTILKPKMQKLFPNLELLGGTLATKIKGKSNLKAHNDWDIVDEHQFKSYNLWLTLVDTNKKNGTLGLIPNSHLWQHHHRGFNIPSTFETYTEKFIKIGFEPDLRAGQAILYNHKLIHYSRPNITDNPRNVAIVGMKDRESSLQVSFSLDNKNIETYVVEESDFYNFDAQKIKEHKILISKECVQNQYKDWDDIYATYTKYINEKYFVADKISIWNKLKKIISR
jgi:hypothetical protein